MSSDAKYVYGYLMKLTTRASKAAISLPHVINYCILKKHSFCIVELFQEKK